MGETKMLYSHVEPKQPRSIVVTREEWERIFSEYPAGERHQAANLAAHNWDVAMIEGRIVIACSWANGYWLDKDGARTPLTEAEMDQFFPDAGELRYPQASYHPPTKKYRLSGLRLPGAAE